MTNAGPRSSVLALNSGSSSLKFGLYRIEASIAEGAAFGRGRNRSAAAKISSGRRTEAATCWFPKSANFETHRDAIARVGKFLADRNAVQPAAVGHRVVHGGSTLRQHCLIDEGVQRQFESAAAFAPLHNPPALAVIRFAQEHFPQVPQVACFDTAFHAAMPEVARTMPIPAELRSDGIRRYGFHGLSCEVDHAPARGPSSRIGSSLRISVTASASPRSKAVNRWTPAWG